MAAQWSEQVAAEQTDAVAELKSRGLLPASTSTEIATGSGREEATDELEWEQGEVLVVGSSPIDHPALVSLGSRAIKINRYSPVPVVVVPVVVVPAAIAAQAAEAIVAGSS